MLDSLPSPYARADLNLIRRAASQDWDIDDEAKQVVARRVVETRDHDDASESTRRAAIRTLAILEQKKWLQ